MAAHVELAAVLAVMVVGGTLGGRWVLWEFRHRRHQERVAAARVEPVRVGEGDPRFGSMQLEDDWPGGSSCSFLPAPERRLPDSSTRELMLAELSPEALELPQGPRAAVSWGAGPGPGAGSSSAPGPGEMSEGALWLPSAPSHGQRTREQVEDRGSVPTGMLAPVPAHERLADTGEIASARQLAEWDADLRAQDDDAARYLAGLGLECERYRLEMAEAWA